MTASDPRPSVVVLLSGAGSTTAALLTAAADPDFPVQVAAVGSDRGEAAGLGLAHEQGVPTFVVRPGDYPDRYSWSRALAQEVVTYRPTVVVCAGLMRILDQVFLTEVAVPVVNSHPSLLPSFPGAHAVRDALAAGVKVTGATFHLVDAGVDTGPIIDQCPVEVLPGDDEQSLHARIKDVEREMLVRLVPALGTRIVTVEGRKVQFA